MTKQEAKAATFILTVVPTALLSVALTRLALLARYDTAAVVPLVFGCILLVVDILYLTLTDE